ncbi:MAG TPA: hypothetical protein DIW66_22870 [Serratia liquefaciens]|nr:hypothetical protein [Serratia liquefaciens]
MKTNQENQFIDFRLITQRGKNHAFIPLCQKISGGSIPAFFVSAIAHRKLRTADPSAASSRGTASSWHQTSAVFR